MSVRLLIAQRENQFAELLGGHFERTLQYLSIQIVRTVSELREAAFDVAIVDIDLADGDSLEWLRAHTAAGSRGKVVLLTACEKDVMIHLALQCQVAGCVHKNDPLEFLDIAVRTVIAGGSIVSPRIQAIRSRLHADPHFYPKVLSSREQSVLAEIGARRSNGAIAKALGIAPATVLDHRKNLMAKLNLHTSEELYAYALEKGFTALRGQPHRCAPVRSPLQAAPLRGGREPVEPMPPGPPQVKPQLIEPDTRHEQIRQAAKAKRERIRRHTSDNKPLS